MLTEIIRSNPEQIDYFNIDEIIDSIDSNLEKVLCYNSIRKFWKAYEFADDTQKEQLIKNALLWGDYRCIKKAGISIDVTRFVTEKVLPYLTVFKDKDGYYLDEQLLFECLNDIGGDHRKHIICSLEIMDKFCFRDPVKKLILAKYVGDEQLTAKYHKEMQGVPLRNSLESRLAKTGVTMIQQLQKGDDCRMYPKDSYVFLGKLKNDYFVFKEIINTHTDASKLNGITNEYDILKKLNHENIVKCYGTINVEGTEFLVLEYIENKPKTISTPDEIKQLASAYKHMKQNRVLYLDFKSKNILFDGQKIKIVDFGWSQIARNENYTSLSTRQYIAPEVGWTFKADEKSDVFALGIYLHKRLTGLHPFSNSSISAQFDIPCLVNYTLANTLSEPDLSHRCYQDIKLKTLIKNMLEKKKEYRPCIEEITQIYPC